MLITTQLVDNVAVELNIDTPAVNLDVNAVVGGGGGGVPDEAWTQVDVTDSFASIVPGGAVSLGTGGSAHIRWTRHGRTIFGKLFASFASDHGDGFTYLDLVDAGLPTPLDPSSLTPNFQVFAGAFAYLAVPETTTGAFDGWLEPLGTAIADGSPPFLSFIQMHNVTTDGGIGNLWDTLGGGSAGLPAGTTTRSVGGRAFYLYAAFNYEAATAA